MLNGFTCRLHVNIKTFKEECMVEKRRSFLKTTVLGSGVALTGVTALASSTKAVTNGVVVGKSKKTEITYTKTKAWEDFYQSAL